jgi:uncharacterized OsmC-like protein
LPCVQKDCPILLQKRVATTWRGQTRTRAEVESFSIGGQEVSRRFTIDIDEPHELCGTNQFANPQEHLIAALNACIAVGYVAQCAVRGITLESLEIETEGDIDLRGFLGLDPQVANGYESLRYTVHIKGNRSEQQFAEIHDAVMATSPNVYNLDMRVCRKIGCMSCFRTMRRAAGSPPENPRQLPRLRF